MDPLTGALVGAGLSQFWASVAATAILAAASTAISTGLSAVARSLQNQPGRPETPAPPVRQVVKQATPPQRYVMGRALVGGAISYMASKPPYLIVQYLVAAHRCDGLEAVYVNGHRCEFSAAGEAISPRFRRNGVPYLEISTRLGDPDQAIDPLLAAEFPDLPTTFRQRGTTTVTLKAYYGDDFDDHEAVWGPGGQFSPAFLIRGKPVYDSRDSRQDRDDETTWRWSDNWALCIADWIRSRYGGRKLATQIDWAAVAAEADLCDQGIGLSDGTSEKRYTFNGGFTSEESPFQLLERFLNAAGDAAALWRRGEFAPRADMPRAPVRTLTQGDLAGPFTFRSGRPRSSSLNTARSEFIHPGRDYKQAMSPPLVDAALLATDGQPLESTVRRPFAAGEERAQRLDKITLKRSRLGRELTIRVGVEHLDLETGDVVNVEIADFPFLDGAWSIRATSFDEAQQKIDLTLEEDAPEAVHLWDATTEVQDTSLTEILEAA